MQDLFSSFLIQTKECHLPGIGSFKMNTVPASLDVASKEIIPPFDEITFDEYSNPLSNEMIAYIAFKLDLSSKDAAEQVKNWCLQNKERLERGEEVHFENFGFLKSTPGGNVSFHSLSSSQFFEPVAAERIIHKDAEHAVLVGDKQTTNTALSELYSSEEKPFQLNWKIAALVLLIIGLSVIALHFYSGENTGGLKIASPPETYIAK